MDRAYLLCGYASTSEIKFAGLRFFMFKRIQSKGKVIEYYNRCVIMSQEEHGSYRELLFNPKWTEKRHRILERDNFRCRNCGSTDNLVVHHKQYHFNVKLNKKCDPWDYDDKYLVTLCESCHSRGHNKYQIPMKNI